jgi:hypothetical protein
MNVINSDLSLHTGEVAGSIPAAPTIFQGFRRTPAHASAERYRNTPQKSVRNRCAKSRFVLVVVAGIHLRKLTVDGIETAVDLILEPA